MLSSGTFWRCSQTQPNAWPTLYVWTVGPQLHPHHGLCGVREYCQQSDQDSTMAVFCVTWLGAWCSWTLLSFSHSDQAAVLLKGTPSGVLLLLLLLLSLYLWLLILTNLFFPFSKTFTKYTISLLLEYCNILLWSYNIFLYILCGCPLFCYILCGFTLFWCCK